MWTYSWLPSRSWHQFYKYFTDEYYGWRITSLHLLFSAQWCLTLRCPWTAANQASLSFTISWSLLKLISIESVMLSNHLILCPPHPPLLLLPSIFLASGSFPMSRLFASGGQSIGASASALPVNIQGWFPFGLTGWIALLSKGLSRVFSSTWQTNHRYPSALSLSSKLPSPPDSSFSLSSRAWSHYPCSSTAVILPLSKP